MVGLHPKMQLARILKRFGGGLYVKTSRFGDGIADVAGRAHIALYVIVLRPFLFDFGHHVDAIVKNVFGGLGEDGVGTVLLLRFLTLLAHHIGRVL